MGRNVKVCSGKYQADVKYYEVNSKFRYIRNIKFDFEMKSSIYNDTLLSKG